MSFISRPIHNSAAGMLVCLLGFTAIAAGQSGLKVQYRNHDTDSPDNQVYALYQIINTGPAPVPMSALTLRYWYTEDGTQAQTLNCDFAQFSAANVTSKFVALANPVPLADTYYELGFTAGAGSIAAGQSSGEIQTRIHKNDFSNYIQTNDYSFDPNQQFVYEDWPKVTLYLNGVLVWGVEPTPPVTLGPGVPVGLTVTGVTGTSVSLSWTASTGAVGYDVLNGTTIAGSPVTTSFTVTGLSPNTNYTFSVRAKDAGGNLSGLSVAVAAQTTSVPDTIPPTVPTGLTVTETTSTSVSLSWIVSTDNVAVSGYDILNGTSMVGSATATSFTVAGLTPGTTYTFSVRARDVRGNVSAPSVAVTATTGAATTPTTLKLQYRNHDTDSPDNQVYALYQIMNTGTTAVPMSAITLRYWYTEDGALAQVFNCDFAQVGAGNVTSKFVTLGSAVPLADTYYEIGFTAAAGTLGAGQSSGEIQTRIHKIDFSNFIQTNDYSFDPNQKFVYEDWPKVTLYINGVLVWGVEPK